MGSFFLDLLSFEHETAVYEKDPMRMRFTYNCQRFTQLDEIKEFNPDLVINAVTVKYFLHFFVQEKAPVFQGENLERREPVRSITGHPWYHSLCCTFCGYSHFARSAFCGESLPL